MKQEIEINISVSGFDYIFRTAYALEDFLKHKITNLDTDVKVLSLGSESELLINAEIDANIEFDEEQKNKEIICNLLLQGSQVVPDQVTINSIKNEAEIYQSELEETKYIEE